MPKAGAKKPRRTIRPVFQNHPALPLRISQHGEAADWKLGRKGRASLVVHHTKTESSVVSVFVAQATSCGTVKADAPAPAQLLVGGCRKSTSLEAKVSLNAKMVLLSRN
jgi:hypothetical protein